MGPIQWVSHIQSNNKFHILLLQSELLNSLFQSVITSQLLNPRFNKLNLKPPPAIFTEILLLITSHQPAIFSVFWLFQLSRRATTAVLCNCVLQTSVVRHSAMRHQHHHYVVHHQRLSPLSHAPPAPLPTSPHTI